MDIFCKVRGTKNFVVSTSWAPSQMVIPQSMSKKWYHGVWMHFLVPPGLDFMPSIIFQLWTVFPYITYFQNCEIYYKNSGKSLRTILNHEQKWTYENIGIFGINELEIGCWIRFWCLKLNIITSLLYKIIIKGEKSLILLGNIHILKKCYIG